MRPYQQILLALLLASGLGLWLHSYSFSPDSTEKALAFGNTSVHVLGYIGDLFLRALKMLIVPLIASSIIVGITELGGGKGFGRLGLKTLSYYLLTSFLSILIGLGLVNAFKPGLKDGLPNTQIIAAIEAQKESLATAAEKKVEKTSGAGLGIVADVFRRMIPTNVVQAATENGQMLSLIFVSLLVSFGLLHLAPETRAPLVGIFKSLHDLMLVLTHWIMCLAPIGIFGLMGKTVAVAGGDLFGVMGKFFLVVLLSLGIHFFIILPCLLFFLGKINPWRHLLAMRDALLTAFSTASSSATLPITLSCMKEKAGVSERISSFVLPLGATVNMDGTALYECVAVLFIAQVMGIEMSIAQQFIIVALALLTSIGVAGVPSASLVAITLIVDNVGISNAAPMIGAILAVDRLLDMSRTAVNVYSDSCGAAIVDKWEKARGRRSFKTDAQE